MVVTTVSGPTVGLAFLVAWDCVSGMESAGFGEALASVYFWICGGLASIHLLGGLGDPRVSPSLVLASGGHCGS